MRLFSEVTECDLTTIAVDTKNADIPGIGQNTRSLFYSL